MDGRPNKHSSISCWEGYCRWDEQCHDWRYEKKRFHYLLESIESSCIFLILCALLVDCWKCQQNKTFNRNTTTLTPYFGFQDIEALDLWEEKDCQIKEKGKGEWKGNRPWYINIINRSQFINQHQPTSLPSTNYLALLSFIFNLLDQPYTGTSFNYLTGIALFSHHCFVDHPSSRDFSKRILQSDYELGRDRRYQDKQRFVKHNTPAQFWDTIWTVVLDHDWRFCYQWSPNETAASSRKSESEDYKWSDRGC